MGAKVPRLGVEGSNTLGKVVPKEESSMITRLDPGAPVLPPSKYGKKQNWDEEDCLIRTIAVTQIPDCTTDKAKPDELVGFLQQYARNGGLIEDMAIRPSVRMVIQPYPRGVPQIRGGDAGCRVAGGCPADC